MLFKRNQVEEAVSGIVRSNAETTANDVPTRLKRLLDTDRSLGRNPRSVHPEEAHYAFYSGEAPGSGVEVWFSAYEAFALLVAFLLLEHGFPQQKAVAMLRAVRPILELEHARIMTLDPKAASVSRAARPGQLVTSGGDHVFLVIPAGKESKLASEPIRLPRICRGEADLMRAIKDSGGPNTIFEIVGSAHRLRQALLLTEPSQRGRTAG